MTRYRTTDGEFLEKSIIDRRVRQAKEEKLNQHLDEHDYLFCTTCKRNDCLPIDCAHVVSVDECQKQGRAELAWYLGNIVIEGRNCHKKRDGHNLCFLSDSIPQ